MEWYLKIPRLELSHWAPSENWERLFDRWLTYRIKGIILPFNLNQEVDKVSDTISSLSQSAKLYNIQVWLILPVLNNPNISDQTWHNNITHRNGKVFDFPKWFAPLCPSNIEYQEFVDEKISKFLLNLDIDLWLLDYLRFPYFWEQWGNVIEEGQFPPFCYCDLCKQSFQNEMNQSLAESVPELILRWQCLSIEKLTSRISRTIKNAQPKLQVGMQILPLISKRKRQLRPEWVGQHIHSLQKHVDFFSPLLYGKLLDWTPDQILSYLVEFTSTQKLPVIPSFQISSTRWDRQSNKSKISLFDFAQRIKPLGIESATLFHAKDLLNLEEIQKTLGPLGK